MVPQIEALGATLVALSPQLPEKSLEMEAQHKLTVPILRDEGNRFADQLGLKHGFPDDLKETYLAFGIDLGASNGEESWTLPIPARYVIAQDGKVVSARIDADYTVRPEPEETLAVLERLRD